MVRFEKILGSHPQKETSNRWPKPRRKDPVSPGRRTSATAAITPTRPPRICVAARLGKEGKAEVQTGYTTKLKLKEWKRKNSENGMVGKGKSFFWKGLFSGAMLVLGMINWNEYQQFLPCWWSLMSIHEYL